jgi:putative resolvase
MYLEVMSMENYLTSTEIKKIFRLGMSSLKLWESKGLLHPVKTPGGHRRYLESEIQAMLGVRNEVCLEKSCAIYARVSTQKQADSGNLDRQFDRLFEYCKTNNMKLISSFKEIASGLNENRKELKKLLSLISEKKIDILLIEYKDRLARFGFKYLEEFCNAFEVTIVELENQIVKEPQEELVEDMISIVTSFSARLYGKRGGRVAKKLSDFIEKEVNSNENDSKR